MQLALSSVPAHPLATAAPGQFMPQSIVEGEEENSLSMAKSGNKKANKTKAEYAHQRTNEVASADSVERDYPLRSKRRLKTRATLIKSALELMSERGFDNVTMQEIADRAGTHAQTLYSHFPNKYALHAAAAVEELRIAMSKRDTDTISFWRSWVETRSKATLAEGAVDVFSGLVADMLDKPRFALVRMAVSQEYVTVLVENLAKDFELDSKLDLFPKLVAQMLMAASEHSIMTWNDAPSDYDLLAGELSGVDEVARIVDLVCEEKGILRKS